MIGATRRWFKRNRTTFAIGAGAVGVAYLAGQYAWSKWLEARQRMSEDRIAKENLRRRFEQNQEDCTYTVLALLPTVRDEIVAALPVEDITNELQRQKAERLGLGRSEGAASSTFPSAPASTIDDDRASLSSLQSSSYVHASQMADSSMPGMRPRKTKAQLWYDMKIASITRALTLIYTLSLLTLLTRIQLNLLGRRTYLSSVVSLASPPSAREASVISLENNDDDNYDNVYGNDFDTNRKYLTFSWWLLHRGSKSVMDNVAAAVKQVFGPLNPREDMTLERLSELILDVRKKVEGATQLDRRDTRWLPHLLPPRDQEDFVLRESGMSASSPPTSDEDAHLDYPSSSAGSDLNPSLRRLLDETSDLIDSPTFSHVLTLVLNTAFSHLIDYRISTEAFKSTADVTPSRVLDISSQKCKLASTLAVFCRQAHVIAAGSGDADELSAAAGLGAVPNEYLAAIDQVKDLEAFAAVIYSSNFDFEAVQAVQDDLDRQDGAAEPDEKESTAEGLQGQEIKDDVPAEVRSEIEALSGDPLEEVAEAIVQSAVITPVDVKPEDSAPFESAWVKALRTEDGIKTETEES